MKPEEQINKILEEEYIPIMEDIKSVEGQMRAETAVKRYELHELFRKQNSKENALRKKRQKVVKRILEIWKEHFDENTSIDVPIGKVTRCNFTKIEINDVAAVIDALDRADRLDLVKYSFDETKVKDLFLKGKLEGLPEDAVKIEGSYRIMLKKN